MGLKLITAPASEPISLEQAKAHLRETSTAQDDLIEALITAARTRVEKETGRAMITQTLELARDYFDCPADLRYVTPPYPTTARAILLPNPPLQAVKRITYYDGSGVETLLHDEIGSPTVISDLIMDTHSQPGRVVPAANGYWPAAQSRANAVLIRYTAGYGNDGESVPAPLKQAMLLLISHFYENREAVGESMAELPLGVEYLLQPYRILSVA